MPAFGIHHGDESESNARCHCSTGRTNTHAHPVQVIARWPLRLLVSGMYGRVLDLHSPLTAVSSLMRELQRVQSCVCRWPADVTITVQEEGVERYITLGILQLRDACTRTHLANSEHGSPCFRHNDVEISFVHIDRSLFLARWHAPSRSIYTVTCTFGRLRGRGWSFCTSLF